MLRKASIDAPGALHHIIADGRRSDLVGGGLIRSAGGWSAVKALRRVELAKKVDLAQPTVSQAVLRGKKIAEKQGLNLIE